MPNGVPDPERGLYAPDGSYRVTVNPIGTPQDPVWDGVTDDETATVIAILKLIAQNTGA